MNASITIWKGICVVSVFYYRNCWQMNLILWSLPQKALEGSPCLVYHFWLLCFYSSYSWTVGCKIKVHYQTTCFLTLTMWQRLYNFYPTCWCGYAVLGMFLLSTVTNSPLTRLTEFCPGRAKSLPCRCEIVCTFVWSYTCLNPSLLWGVLWVWEYVCVG